MTPEINQSLRAGATLLALLAIAPGCSSSLPGAADGGGGNGGGNGGGTCVPIVSGGGTGGTASARCNYQDPAVTCGPGEGCLWECFGDSGFGECVSLPTACDASLAPVCGCDGKTYANECLLKQMPLRKDHDGPCVFDPTDMIGYVRLRAGLWSGTGIRMTVTATGAALSFAGASGTIDQPLDLAKQYAVSGPLTRRGSWQGTRSGGGSLPASVTYEAWLNNAALDLHVMDQSWTLRYEDAGAPFCP